jgi:hypothetical protein
MRASLALAIHFAGGDLERERRILCASQDFLRRRVEMVLHHLVHLVQRPVAGIRRVQDGNVVRVLIPALLASASAAALPVFIAWRISPAMRMCSRSSSVSWLPALSP